MSGDPYRYAHFHGTEERGVPLGPPVVIAASRKDFRCVPRISRTGQRRGERTKIDRNGRKRPRAWHRKWHRPEHDSALGFVMTVIQPWVGLLGRLDAALALCRRIELADHIESSRFRAYREHLAKLVATLEDGGLRQLWDAA